MTTVQRLRLLAWTLWQVDTLDAISRQVVRVGIGFLITAALAWFGIFAVWVLDHVSVAVIGWLLLGIVVAWEVDRRVVRGK